jgi:hypothetical protein
MCGTPTYNAWANMKNRCTSANGPLAKWYYDKGITYCEEWETFEGFYKDMGDKPPRTHLDRIDNSLGYCKSNCRWAPLRVSYLNRSFVNNKDSLPAGIRLNKAGNFSVRGKYKGKEFNIGTFKTLEEAMTARQKWSDKHDS